MKAQTPGMINTILVSYVSGIVSFSIFIDPTSNARLLAIYDKSIAEQEPAFVAVPITLSIRDGTVSEMNTGLAILLRPPANPITNLPITSVGTVNHIYGTIEIIIIN